MNERLLAYVDTILGIIEPDMLMERTVEFLVEEFKLSNCSLHVYDKIHRFYDGAKETLNNVEADIWKHLQEAKIPASAEIQKEWSSEKGINKLAPLVYAVPWVKDRELKGMCCLYAERPVTNALRFSQAVIDKLGRALVSAERYHKAQMSAVTDRLTGLYNRAYFMEALERELQRARMDSLPTSLLIFDVDNFKNFNDTHGHPEGDVVLVKMADCIRHNIRPSDIACRYGGEEFVVILPKCDVEAAFNRAEQLRQEVESKSPLTISVGLMTCKNSSATAETMLKEADKALYKAKENGKNRTMNKVIIDKNMGVIDVQDAQSIGKPRLS